MQIPKQFQLFGEKFHVVWDKTLSNRDDLKGSVCYRDNVIRLQKKIEGIVYPKEAIEETYLHELVHLILERMGETKLRRDEKFVNLFASMLHQIIVTSKGRN